MVLLRYSQREATPIRVFQGASQLWSALRIWHPKQQLGYRRFGKRRSATGDTCRQ